MPTYVIGDVHGCLDQLEKLLIQLNFDATRDYLWFTGDLVNRGPHSLEVLRFIKNLGSRAVSVLGNHDILLLAVGFKILKFDSTRHSFGSVLEAPDCQELLNWLLYRPLIHFDPIFECLLVHAGLPPQWDLITAFQKANSLSEALQTNAPALLYALFTSDDLKPEQAAWRYTSAALTQLRFCAPDGTLDLKHKHIASPAGTSPWFEHPQARWAGTRIAFGHWAALRGNCCHPDCYALDEACSWGGALAGLCLDDGSRHRVIFKAS